ncbi:hypothetical protein ACHAWT_008617 [Skeletonema menzelii]
MNTVKFSFKGRSETVTAPESITASALLALARESLQIDDEIVLKLIFKGKTIASSAAADDDEGSKRAFPEGVKMPKGGAKVIVMGTMTSGIATLNSMRSDPLMRGFDEEKLSVSCGYKSGVTSTFWGPKLGSQHPKYKFCRLEECKDASFGTRPTSSTPHAFEARRLMEQLATDPGVVQVLTSRELVVGCLGEMDPIDDRLMQKKKQEGACLLGYNTNHGLAIHIKLRTDDLSSFRPYNELASTLIHELSHNWVSEHDVLFWTNYGQMRVEYLWKHACLILGGLFVNGKRTASLALIMDMIIFPSDGKDSPSKSKLMDNICQSVINELSGEMAQHHLPVQLVAPAVIGFGKDLMLETQDESIGFGHGQRLGTSSDDENSGLSVRERALAAAEKRAREAKEEK